MNKDNKKVSFKRLNISMNSELVDQLDQECDRLGLTRSGYLTVAVKLKMQQDTLTTNLPEFLKFVGEISAAAQNGKINESSSDLDLNLAEMFEKKQKNSLKVLKED